MWEHLIGIWSSSLCFSLIIFLRSLNRFSCVFQYFKNKRFSSSFGQSTTQRLSLV
uniref:Uncharacterized protein n=1 Tax=Rhizophora mucronata TaxID=61149 RepID=A0A2P2NF47_RHIMU